MNILYVSAKKKWGGVVSWQVHTARELEKRGHRVWIISAKNSALTRNAPKDIRLLAKKIGMNYSPLMIAYLIRFIKKENINVIASNIKKELIAAGAAARWCGIPSLRFIGNEKDFNNSRFLQKRLIDLYIVPCAKTKKLAMQRHRWLKEDDFAVIHIGHNLVHFPQQQIPVIAVGAGAVV